jgi:hypothetical protein
MGDANDKLNKWVVTWICFCFLCRLYKLRIPDQIERSAGDLVLDRGPPQKKWPMHTYMRTNTWLLLVRYYRYCHYYIYIIIVFIIIYIYHHTYRHIFKTYKRIHVHSYENVCLVKNPHIHTFICRCTSMYCQHILYRNVCIYFFLLTRNFRHCMWRRRKHSPRNKRQFSVHILVHRDAS